MKISNIPPEFKTTITPKEIICILEDYKNNYNNAPTGILHYHASKQQVEEEVNEIINSVKELPDTPIEIIDISKYSPVKNRQFAEHLMLQENIIDPILKRAIKNAPTINQDHRSFGVQWNIIDRWTNNNYFKSTNISKAVSGYITNKQELPFIFALKACSLTGYGNHPHIIQEHHTANDRTAHYDKYFENTDEHKMHQVNNYVQYLKILDVS